MPCKSSIVLLVLLIAAASSGAGSAGRGDFGPAALPAAFPGAGAADQAEVAADLRRKLPERMSIAIHAHFIVAFSGSLEETRLWSRTVADYDAGMRRRLFPNLGGKRTLVILGNGASVTRSLAETLYPTAAASAIPASGFYHRGDSLILADTGDGSGALANGLMHALVQQDNPRAPGWFEDALATLYESAEWRGDRLTPLLDERMDLIPRDEDLDYGVFAGVCDCSPVDDQQRALMRLLLVFLDERERLAALYAAIEQLGPYTTLLQALEAMEFDADAWKAFAERSVRNAQTPASG